MRSDAWSKVALFLSFAGISTAIVVAYLNPATGYELSIYKETPVSFWALSTLALLVSIWVVFSGSSRIVRGLGAFLGGMTMTAIVSLPIVRGYYYVGEQDSLSHLGTAKDMNAGLRTLTENRYPVVHTLGSVLHDVTGLELPDAMVVLIVVFVVCFFVFVPLVVRELTGDVWMTYVGLYSGLLLLPINHLGSHHYIFPTSQAIMYAPAFLFVFFVLYEQRTARHSTMFLVIAPTFVLLHPQQAANLVLFFGVIAAMQIGYDFLRGYGLNRRDEWVLPEATFYAIVFWLWVRNLDTFWSHLERVLMIPFQETRPAESTATRSVSLAEVGGSLPEVFVKLFLVSSVYALLTGLLLVLVLKRTERFESRTSDVTVASDGGSEQLLPLYIFGGLLAVTLMFLVFLFGGISDQYFRHLGTLMVFATILGAILLGRAMQYAGHRWSDRSARRSIMLALVLFTVLSLPVVFPSPYIYYSFNHVTEEQMSGYETTFEYQEGSVAFDDIRSDTYRYGDAIQGTDLPPEVYYQEEDWTDTDHGIPDHFAYQSLRLYYEERRYIPVPEADRIRDPVLWDGFRFSHEDFDYLDTEPGINRVQTNGGYDLYLVEPRDDQLARNADER